MAKLFTLWQRVVVGAGCALLLCAGTVALSAHATVNAQQNTNANQAQPKKKKLPPGAKGFETYAGRDASDKLVTGGATRGMEDVLARGNEAYATAQEKEKAGETKEAALQYQKAVDAYKEVVKGNPKMFKAYFSLGAAYEALGQFKEATDAYKHAVGLTPDPERDTPDEVLVAYYNLGNAFASAGFDACSAFCCCSSPARLSMM